MVKYVATVDQLRMQVRGVADKVGAMIDDVMQKDADTAPEAPATTAPSDG